MKRLQQPTQGGEEAILLWAESVLPSLLPETLEFVRGWLVRDFCHRTGQRGRETPTPLYRLRSAWSR